jgi:hypothetical protein
MSNTVDWLLTLLVLWGGTLMGLTVGVTYFVKSRPDAPLSVRLLSSAFGPSLAVVFLVASFWWPESYRYKPVGVQALYWLQVLPLFLLCFALAKYPGRRGSHLVLVPAGLLAWAWIFFWSWLFVHGE